MVCCLQIQIALLCVWASIGCQARRVEFLELATVFFHHPFINTYITYYWNNIQFIFGTFVISNKHIQSSEFLVCDEISFLISAQALVTDGLRLDISIEYGSRGVPCTCWIQLHILIVNVVNLWFNNNQRNEHTA